MASADIERMADDLGLRTAPQVSTAIGGALTTSFSVVIALLPGQRGWGQVTLVVVLFLLTAGMWGLAVREKRRPVDKDKGDAIAEMSPAPSRASRTAGKAHGDGTSGVPLIPHGPRLEGSTEARHPASLCGEGYQLHQALVVDRSGVIVVHGPPGADQSKLVDRVLAEAGLCPRVHELAHGGSFDAGTLLDDIEAAQLGDGTGRGGDLLCRLMAVLQARYDSPVPLVIEVTDAQRLLDPGTRVLGSRELAEALGVISRWRGRQVKVILLVQGAIHAGPASEWLEEAAHVLVGGLADPVDFRALLEGLGPAGECAVDVLDPGRLRDVLLGDPQLAQLFCAELALSGGQLSPGELVAQLADEHPQDRGRRLARAVLERLSLDQLRVVMALDAFGTPVSAELVSDLFGGQPAAGEMAGLLDELAHWHVIGKTADGYYLALQAIHDTLPAFCEAPAALLHHAAALLSDVDPREVQRLEEMRWPFAQLELWIRAREWPAAYDLINKMDQVLQLWNAAGALLRYRLDIAGQLSERFQEMVNYNALGRLYLSSGDFDEACEAFGNALRNARGPGGLYGRRKIYVNLAALHWEAGDTRRAAKYYRTALLMAGKHGDRLDRAVAATGLADCYRRWGDYRKAMDKGKVARKDAEAAGPPALVRIAVKLARWHSELGDREDADDMMGVAGGAAAEQDDPGLFLQCLDGRADLLLDAGELDEARSVARLAASKALELHDPAMALRAWVTMATSSLMQGDILAARREIEHAARYRRPGRFLVVLVLQALIALQALQEADARRYFATLRAEAMRRRERDRKDFAAWEYEGLALCGLGVGEPGTLASAVTAFRRARKRTSAPVLVARLSGWLGIVEAASGTASGQLAAVRAAAVGDTAPVKR